MKYDIYAKGSKGKGISAFIIADSAESAVEKFVNSGRIDSLGEQVFISALSSELIITKFEMIDNRIVLADCDNWRKFKSK